MRRCTGSAFLTCCVRNWSEASPSFERSGRTLSVEINHTEISHRDFHGKRPGASRSHFETGTVSRATPAHLKELQDLGPKVKRRLSAYQPFVV